MAVLVAYRRTEASAKAILAQRLEAERARRREAERIAWEARMAQARQMDERRAAIAEERKARGEPYRHTFHEIERRALKLFKMRRNDLQSNRRNKDVVFARQFVTYWACRLTKRSLPEIGRLLGGFDHTTCLSSKRAYPKKRAKMGRYLREVK